MSFVLYLAEPALILPGDEALRVMVYAEEFWLHGSSESCFYEFALYLCACGHTSVCLLIAFYSAAGRIKKKKGKKSGASGNKKPLMAYCVIKKCPGEFYIIDRQRKAIYFPLC